MTKGQLSFLTSTQRDFDVGFSWWRDREMARSSVHHDAQIMLTPSWLRQIVGSILRDYSVWQFETNNTDQLVESFEYRFITLCVTYIPWILA